MIIMCCDANPELGFGHLMRCRTLAEALQDIELPSIMVGPALEYRNESDYQLFQAWYSAPQWLDACSDAERLAEIAREHQSRLLVLDDYRVNESYQLYLRAQKLRWLQFEGRVDKPLWADWLINANPAVCASDYRQLRQQPEFLLGPAYAMLRDEFQGEPTFNIKPQVERVLLAFGAGDDRGAAIKLLEYMLPQTQQRVRYHILSGAANPRNQDVSSWIQKHGKGQVELIINPSQVAPLMRSCDLALTSGGTLTYELAALGVPMLIVAITSEQKCSLAWQQRQAAIFLGELETLTEVKIMQPFLALSDAPEKRLKLAKAASVLVDGRGAKRTAQILARAIQEAPQ